MDDAAAAPAAEAGPALAARPRILALANQKGGVGKTTTAVNLATALAATGRRVLLVDCDQQGNASTGLAIGRTERSPGTYELLLGEATLTQAIRPTAIAGLDLVPASIHLLGAEMELQGEADRNIRLRQALAPAAGRYDYVLLDCPPSLLTLTLNALVAADAVIVPLQAEFYAMEGLSQLVNTIERVRAGLNPQLSIAGVVLTMMDRRNNLSEAVAAEVRAHFGGQVFKTEIPRNVRVSEAPSHGLPVLVYDHRCAGARAYIDLARELLARDAEESVLAA